LKLFLSEVSLIFFIEVCIYKSCQQ